MTHDARSALLNAALATAERGWPVFPLRPGDKRPAGHPEHRCPRTGRCSGGHLKWEQRATTDPALIRAAWTARPYNIGIATGPAGLLVVDLDRPKTKNEKDTPGGVTTFEALCERAGQAVPATRRIRTASGGFHLYFTAPAGARMTNSASRLGPLVDTRAWGGYVVAPSSTTPAGAYAVVDDLPAAPLPKWLYARLMARQVSRGLFSLPSAHRASRYATAALEAETAAVRDAHEGRRDTTLLRAARALGRFIAWGDLPRSVVEEALQAAGASCGLPERQCRSTVRSGLDWSIARNSTRPAA
ncbi:bifunctional DNA primase/polymerase [Streptomyces marincola]|uniref:bifunctional DNA primase/polymerase n=1 Tax=Streptomyces marincola TaxID=2878388 RepID=UPI001CF2E443|nr:bifunctional DNA primase/polymerase [Streptomyces marincola]UCM89184.1 bifunctional DNA primase/polymerase [Streptomyces marincola]